MQTKLAGASELHDFTFLCLSLAEKNIVTEYLFYQPQAKHDSIIDVKMCKKYIFAFNICIFY
jgi:hypothetical protein